MNSPLPVAFGLPVAGAHGEMKWLIL